MIFFLITIPFWLGIFFLWLFGRAQMVFLVRFDYALVVVGFFFLFVWNLLSQLHGGSLVGMVDV